MKRPERRLDFARVLPGRRLAFPADYGAHPDFRTEWWYATGWLTLPDGSPAGFPDDLLPRPHRHWRGQPERLRPASVDPRPRGDRRSGPWPPAPRRTRRPRRLRARRLRHRARPDAWVGDWRFAQRAGGYRAEVHGEEFGYALNLVPDGPPLLNGDAGFSAKAPRPASCQLLLQPPPAHGQRQRDARRQASRA